MVQDLRQHCGVALQRFGEIQSGEWPGYAEILVEEVEEVLISRRSRA